MPTSSSKNAAFPVTSVTLLGKLAVQVTGEDQANWERFWNLYARAIRRFAVRLGNENQADDVVALVMTKLVKFFRGGRFDAHKGNFRGYLAQMIRNELGMIYRKEKVRGADRRVYLDDEREPDEGGENAGWRAAAEAEMATAGDAVYRRLDLEWAAAKRQELVAHVLANPAIKPLYRDVFRALQEGKSIDEIVAAHGISRNLVSQIKTRTEKTLAALAAELGG